MDRNLFSRVEACFPFDASNVRKRVYQQGLLNYLQDNQQAWELLSSGQWQRIVPKEGEELYMAQAVLMEKFRG
jgi:polyphosphate kinase